METKEKILLIAYKLFVNNGYHHTSMQKLVEVSGLSKGAFYHHFKNKKDIYAQVIEHYFLSFYRTVDWEKYKALEMTIKDIETKIKYFYLSFLPQILPITENGMSRYFVMYFEAFNLLPEFKKEVQIFYENLEFVLINATDNKEKSKNKAIEIISKYEGLLFLMAINSELSLEEILEMK